MSTIHGLNPVTPSSGALTPVAADAVTLAPGFWRTRQELNSDVLLDHCDTWINRMGWYDTFRAAAGQPTDKPLQGKLFTDADVYKLMEAFAWELGQRPDPVRAARFAELARMVAAAQEEDGYLNTFFGPRGREARYTNLAHGHELYCAGHMFQAAVARLRAGADDEFTRAAIRMADRICDDVDAGLITKSDGHPEIEVALMELYRATGTERYRDLAAHFIEMRGHQTFEHHAIGHEYYLDDVPVREATVLRGHAVRATYLTAGVVDLAVETGDLSLLDATRTQWENTWAKRTYLTGGMGSRHLGESFGRDYELPPDRAYTETCAAVGAVMVAWRLLLATGEAQYGDAIERLLYNMVATSPSAEGDRFFYVNPLLQREPGIQPAEGEAPFRKDTLRANWFWVACCPTNVVRTLSSLTAYVATVDGDAVVIQQFLPGTIAATLADGRTAIVDIDTDYPWGGQIRATTHTPGMWTLRLRVPEWAQEATLETADGVIPAAPGYVQVSRDWAEGDTAVLTLPMRPLLLHPDSRINALRDTAAVQRGPLVYCAEEVVDAADAVDLDRFRLLPGSELVEVTASGPSDVAVTVRVSGVLAPEEPDRPWPYSANTAPDLSPTTDSVDITLIPYYAWSNRGLSTMRVWLPLAPD